MRGSTWLFGPGPRPPVRDRADGRTDGQVCLGLQGGFRGHQSGALECVEGRGRKAGGQSMTEDVAVA